MTFINNLRGYRIILSAAAQKELKKINALYVKDAKDKVTDVYLDLKTYDAIVDKIKKFNKTQSTNAKKEKGR